MADSVAEEVCFEMQCSPTKTQQQSVTPTYFSPEANEQRTEDMSGMEQKMSETFECSPISALKSKEHISTERLLKEVSCKQTSRVLSSGLQQALAEKAHEPVLPSIAEPFKVPVCE